MCLKMKSEKSAYNMKVELVLQAAVALGEHALEAQTAATCREFLEISQVNQTFLTLVGERHERMRRVRHATTGKRRRLQFSHR